MNDLIKGNSEAASWIDRTKAQFINHQVYGKIEAGIVWTNSTSENGELIVQTNPNDLVTNINNDDWPLYVGHDPGNPIGQVLKASFFKNPDGAQFVIAILGYYDSTKQLSFKNLGIDTDPKVSSPNSLDELDPNCWLSLGADTREVDSQWIDDLLHEPPLKFEKFDLSHNTDKNTIELIKIVLPYVTLVWNPFVTSIASEAGKKTYAGIHEWLKKLWKKLKERNNPVVEILSIQNNCQVSFIIRGNDLKINYSAHEQLTKASVQAANLIENLVRTNASAKKIIYEFDLKIERWYPSYAILSDGHFVSDLNILIAHEQLPSGLSLGITKDNEKPSLLI